MHNLRISHILSLNVWKTRMASEGKQIRQTDNLTLTNKMYQRFK